MARSYRHAGDDFYCSSAEAFGYECEACGRPTRKGTYTEDQDGFTIYACPACCADIRADIALIRQEMAA